MANPEYPDEIIEEVEKTPPTLFDIIFILLVFIASFFSAVTTYLGFSYDLPWMMAVALAIIIGLGLFAINLKLKTQRESGHTIAKSLGVFFILFLFSFISNTNAIYTFFLQNDIVKDTQLIAWTNFDKGTISLLDALDKSSITKEGLKLKQQLDPTVETFHSQLCDPENPGLGKKATTHLSEIESILGVSLTRLKEPNIRDMASFKRYCDRYREYIYSVFSDKYTTSQTEEMENLKDSIQRDRVFYETAVNKKDWNSDYTDGMKRGLDTFKERTQLLLQSEVHVPDINIDADEIGSFPYTWRNFVDGINLSAITLSILLSILLDILGPAMAILMYKEEDY